MIWKSFSDCKFIRMENPELRNQIKEILKQIDARALRKQICQKNLITPQTYNNQLSGRTPITIPVLNDILDSVNLDKSKIIKQIISTSKFKSGVGGNSYSVKIPSELSKDLAYFVGAIRDGVLCKRGDKKGEYVLEIYQKNTHWLKSIIKPIIKNLFGIEPIIDEKKMRVRIWSKVVYIFIKDIFEYREAGIRNFILNIGSQHPDKAENFENFLRLSLP